MSNTSLKKLDLHGKDPDLSFLLSLFFFFHYFLPLSFLSTRQSEVDLSLHFPIFLIPGNSIGSEGVKVICKALKHNTSLTELNISGAESFFLRYRTCAPPFRNPPHMTPLPSFFFLSAPQGIR